MTQTQTKPSFLSRFSLEGKVALITGGATGIGQAIALGLAESGADVAVVSHRTGAEDTRRGVEGAGVRFLEVEVNLMESSSANHTLERVVQELGAVDILINNAGMIRRENADAFSEQDWDDVIELNLNAVWRMSQSVGRHMLERGSGKIVNIASLLAFQGGIRVPSYTAAKHAVAGMTKALANEWGARGIQVNAIAPGYISTANTEALRADPVRNKSILERIPAGRWGEASDLAGAAVFLSSSASDYVNGHVLVVDGGWLAR
jgi:2-dehydro-3-deoxy-D-gluconate 5-dehydrogenase